jgi:DNA-binding response OmpR family regulator
VSKRLNDLLIGKIRHNLKTHLNIVCGFSELLLEELEDDEDHMSDAATAALQSINQSGDSIVQYIDQIFAAHNFSLEDVFAQLNIQAQAFKSTTDEFIAQINQQLDWWQQQGPQDFYAEFTADFSKIDTATAGLRDNVESLQSGSISSVETLVEHRVLSQDDINLIGKFSDSLEATPDVLETKYPSSILVVDDNPANTEYLSRKLNAAKHTVFIANSGLEAERLLNGDTHIDLVLLDILMPDLSGYEILGRNRELLQCKNIPVIVVSSLDEQETVYRCLESGAQDFITKPVNFMILAARINSALERKYLLDREEEHLAKNRGRETKKRRATAEHSAPTHCHEDEGQRVPYRRLGRKLQHFICRHRRLHTAVGGIGASSRSRNAEQNFHRV